MRERARVVVPSVTGDEAGDAGSPPKDFAGSLYWIEPRIDSRVNRR